MANISPVGEWIAPGVHRVKWAALTGTADVALGASDITLAYKTINVTGSFNSMVVTIQGSNATDRATATDWGTMHDINGSDLIFDGTAGVGGSRMEAVQENPRWIRPVGTGATGVGTSSVDVIMVSSKS